MACRLNSGVVGGELDNSRPNAVRGRLELSDGRVILLELTGELQGQLAGRHLRFTVARKQADSASDADLPHGFTLRQAGAVGTVSLLNRNVPRCGIEEFLEFRRRGESPPVDVVPHLYVEWYGPNGRVVVELHDPAIACVGPNDAGRPALIPLAVPVTSEGGTPNVTEIGVDDAPLMFTKAARRSWDEVIPGIDPKTKQMYEQWDEMFSGESDVPMLSMFDPPLELRNADELSGDEADEVLDDLLDRLEEIHVSFDICDHFSSQDAYRLLVEQILPVDRIYPKIAETGHKMMYSTFDHCRQCLAEYDIDEVP